MSELPTNQIVPSARIEGDMLLVSVVGEIDLHNSAELRGALLAAIIKHQPKKIILNLAQVPYMDSSAVAVLVEALQKLRKIGGKIYLTDLQPRVKSLLEIARLDTVFILTKNEEEA